MSTLADGLQWIVPGNCVHGLPLLNFFIIDMDKKLDGLLIKFADDTKLLGISNMLENNPISKWFWQAVEHWTKSNKMPYNGDKYKILHLGLKKK